MITKDNHLSRLIDNRFCDLRNRRRDRRGSGSRRWCRGARLLRARGDIFLLLAHRKVQRQKQREDRKSDYHKRSKGFMRGSTKYKCFLQLRSIDNPLPNYVASFKLRAKNFLVEDVFFAIRSECRARSLVSLQSLFSLHWLLAIQS